MKIQSTVSTRPATSGSRRRFLRHLALLGAGFPALASRTEVAAAAAPGAGTLSCNQYTWSVYFARDGRKFGENLGAHLREVAASGLGAFEPMASSPEQIAEMGRALRARELGMRSLYVNSTLHEEKTAGRSIEQVLAIARAAKAAGTEIIVTNPSPIRWGGPENKTDAQLEVQARSLNQLGRKLRDLGLTLAYHNHDIELRNAAREFHHMLTGTSPRNVRFCLDAHWIYRGAGNSQVALFDVVELYADRIVELHIRQSEDGIWTETFHGEGDVDYRRLVAALVRHRVKPWLVLEQAVEKGTPKTMNALEAHQRSVRAARAVFAPLMS